MEAELTYSEAVARGYRILAGDFKVTSAREMKLGDIMVQFIMLTGGRPAVVAQPTGHLAIYRPRSEMETIKDTERRFRIAKLRG